MTQREREREGSISMTPVYRTVQEGLSMVSCREGITKSKHVFLVLYIYIERERERERDVNNKDLFNFGLKYFVCVILH